MGYGSIIHISHPATTLAIIITPAPSDGKLLTYETIDPSTSEELMYSIQFGGNTVLDPLTLIRSPGLGLGLC